MFAEGSGALREWRREYGHDGSEATWPKIQKSANGATLPSQPIESFALTARKPSPKPTTTKDSTGTKTTTASQPVRAKNAAATSTKGKKSATSAFGARPAESPEPAAQDEIDRLLAIGVTEQEAHELVVVGNWNCGALACAAKTNTADGIPPRVVGLLAENWKKLFERGERT